MAIVDRLAALDLFLRIVDGGNHDGVRSNDEPRHWKDRSPLVSEHVGTAMGRRVFNALSSPTSRHLAIGAYLV